MSAYTNFISGLVPLQKVEGKRYEPLLPSSQTCKCKMEVKNAAVGNAIYLQFFNNIIPQIKMQCYRNIHQILI